MSDLRKLTILHSNDIHGDFLSNMQDGHAVGGISFLSGYVNQVRRDEPNVIYAIAGDMLRGSIIDREYKGISTMEIINHLAPDVASLGNHELDYGLAHLLFLEKCATFPIVTANLYIKLNGMRLFHSHVILHVGGMNILIIGIITDEIMANAQKDPLLKHLIVVEDAVAEIGRIVNSYRTYDIDCTILLTHIGFLEDQQLAKMLDPAWGVDIIIGGHSHTFPEAPAEENGILIVQAGCDSRAIGRFDLTIDCKRNSVHDYQWRLVPITEENCEHDPAIDDLLRHYQSVIAEKYNRVLTYFDRPLTHPLRQMETELGNLFADAMNTMVAHECDFALIGSGSLRKKKMGPVITLREFVEIFPFSDRVLAAKIYGRDLIAAMKYMCRDEILTGHTEFYQVPRTIHIVYDFAAKELLTFTFNGEPVEPDRLYTVAMQGFHYDNIKMCLNIDEDRLIDFKGAAVIATSDNDLIKEYFMTHHTLTSQIEGRVTILHRPKQLAE